MKFVRYSWGQHLILLKSLVLVTSTCNSQSLCRARIGLGNELHLLLNKEVGSDVLKMFIFPANFMCKTTIGLVFSRPLSFPWVNRSRRIACSKGRDYSSSSLPVRYVRKKMSESESSVVSSVPKELPEDVNLKKNNFFELKVERAEPYDCHERPDRNLSLDEQEAVSSFISCAGSGKEEINIGLLDEDNDIEEPYELSEKHKCKFVEFCNGKYRTQASGNRQDAERHAIQLLSTRAFTASELRKKLQGKNFPLDIVDVVIADFQNRGYINDCLYAEAFSQSRWSSSCWGPKRIKQALFEKGVSKFDAEEAIKLVFEEDECVEDQELVVGMSKLSMDHLLVQASKQWLRNQKVSSEKRKSRLIQWLQYRGFNWSVISFVLKKLESGYVP